MSVKLYGWAWGQRGLGSTARLVLLALAERADNRTLSCFPTQGQLSEMTGLQERSIGRAMKVLVDAGLVTRERRQRQDGSRTSDLYRMHPQVTHDLTDSESPDIESPDFESPDSESDPTRQRVTPNPTESPTQPDTESEQEEPITLPSLNPSPTHQEMRARFDEFWDAYPLKKGKPKAEAAWDKAIKKTDPDVIIAGVRRYVAEMVGKTISFKYPQGWLSDERWADEPEQPKPTLTRTNQTLLAIAQEYRTQENDHAAIGSSSTHQPHRGVRQA